MLLWLWSASLFLQTYLPMPETCSNSKFRTHHLSLLDVANIVGKSYGMSLHHILCTLHLGLSRVTASFNPALSVAVPRRHQAPYVK